RASSAATGARLGRAAGARAGWVVGLEEGDLDVTAPHDAGPDIRRRGAAIAQLASVDGRAHVVHEPEGTYVGVGDFPFGAALLLDRADEAPTDSEAAGEELRRLVPDAPAMRAIAGRVPVVSQGREDVLGSALSDRRRQDRAGTAYPLLDGHFAIGALVVMGPPLPGDTRLRDQLQRLAVELGARLAAARAVHEAEQRAVSDPLTGLRNRREFDRAVQRHAAGKPAAMAALIYCDLD